MIKTHTSGTESSGHEHVQKGQFAVSEPKIWNGYSWVTKDLTGSAYWYNYNNGAYIGLLASGSGGETTTGIFGRTKKGVDGAESPNVEYGPPYGTSYGLGAGLYINADHRHTIDLSGNTGGASASHNHTYGNATDNYETRPKNYTTKIWKRTA